MLAWDKFCSPGPSKDIDAVRAVLNTYLPRPKNKTGVNLLVTTQAEQTDAREAEKEEAAKPAERINFIKPYISISLIDDATSYPANAVPDHVRTLSKHSLTSICYAWAPFLIT